MIRIHDSMMLFENYSTTLWNRCHKTSFLWNTLLVEDRPKSTLHTSPSWLNNSKHLGKHMAILCGTFYEQAFTRISNLVLSHDCRKFKILFWRFAEVPLSMLSLVCQSISPTFVILYTLLHELDASLLFDLAVGKLAK